MASSFSSGMTTLEKCEAAVKARQAEVKECQAEVKEWQAQVQKLAATGASASSLVFKVADQALKNAHQALKDAKKRLEKAEDHQRTLELRAAVPTAPASGWVFSEDLTAWVRKLVGLKPVTVHDVDQNSDALTILAKYFFPTKTKADLSTTDVKVIRDAVEAASNLGIIVYAIDGCPFYVDNNNSLLVVTASAKTPWDLAVDILLRRTKVSSSGMHQPVKVEIILGNPGIGKSRQLQYAFLQYLARGVQNVVFHQAQNDKLWLFHRNEDTGLYEAYTSLGIAQMRGGVLGDPSTVALLDPYQETCVSVDCLSMVASSPNTSRYKEALKHAASTHYLPTLNVEELAAALPFMCAQCNLPRRTEIESFFHDFGGIPRIILSEEIRNRQRQKMVSSLNNSKNVRNAVESRAIDNEDTSAPLTALFRFIPTRPRFNYYNMSAVSELVAKALCVRYLDKMIEAVENRTLESSTLIGYYWEKHCRNLLVYGLSAQPVRWTWRALSRTEKQVVQFRITGLHNVARSDDEKQSDAFLRCLDDNTLRDKLVCPRPGQPAVDFGIATQRVVFQMFVMKDGSHRMSVKALEQLIQATGSNTVNKLTVYLCVPAPLQARVRSVWDKGLPKKHPRWAWLRQRVLFRVLFVDLKTFDVEWRYESPVSNDLLGKDRKVTLDKDEDMKDTASVTSDGDVDSPDEDVDMKGNSDVEDVAGNDSMDTSVFPAVDAAGARAASSGRALASSGRALRQIPRVNYK